MESRELKPQKWKPPERISEAVAEWLLCCQCYTEHTQRKRLYVLSYFLESLPEGIETIDQLDNSYIKNYAKTSAKTKKYTKERPYAEETLKQHLRIIKSFYRWIPRQYNIPLVIKEKEPEPPKIPVLKSKENPATNVVVDWFNHIRRLAPTTQDNYRRTITQFFEFLPEIETIEQLCPAYIERFIDSLIGENKNSTINNHVAALKVFHRWLPRHYNIPDHGAEIKKLKREPSEPRVLTWEEYEKILAACSGKHKDLFLFLGHTGLRVSALLNLKWRDISSDLTRLTVAYGKGGRRRYIPLNAVCKEVLSKYERGPDNSPLDVVKYWRTRGCVYNCCARLAKRTGIPSFGPHAVRHMFATQLIEASAPLYKVSKILGHASQRTTEKFYIHLLPDSYNGLTDVLAEKQQHQKGGPKYAND